MYIYNTFEVVSFSNISGNKSYIQILNPIYYHTEKYIRKMYLYQSEIL